MKELILEIIEQPFEIGEYVILKYFEWSNPNKIKSGQKFMIAGFYENGPQIKDQIAFLVWRNKETTQLNEIRVSCNLLFKVEPDL